MLGHNKGAEVTVSEAAAGPSHVAVAVQNSLGKQESFTITRWL